MTDDELLAWIANRMERTKHSVRRVVTETKVRFEQPKTENTEQWRVKALTDLREWIQASKDYRKTIETWAAVYIRCGRCLTEWREWCEANSIGDITAWIDAASKVVTEKRWI